MTWPRSSSCERTRFLAALAPDQVLSETEERMLARHLARCPSCRAFAASVAAFTSELRAAQSAVPEAGVALVLRRPRRRSRTTVKLPLVALTAAAAGVLMTSVALRQSSLFTARPSAPSIVGTVENDKAALNQLRTVVHTRELVPDYRSDRPGIYLG